MFLKATQNQQGYFTFSLRVKMDSYLPPANEVWGKVIFLHQFVILFTGGGACVVALGGHAWLLRGGRAWLLWGGACVVAPGGMRGCSGGACVVALGGHAWLLRGACVVAQGACVVVLGGACMVLVEGACVVLFRGRAWFYSGGGGMVFSVFSDTVRYGQ